MFAILSGRRGFKYPSQRNKVFLHGFLHHMVIRRWVIGVYIGSVFAASALSQQYTINTIVGSANTPGFAGDGGSAIGSQLNFPTGIAVDSSGNLYIADGLNNR